MIRFRSSLLTATLIALGLNVAPAHAQQSRSFVSGLGNDANAPNCLRTAPCRTFQVAHDNTLANGEITVLDPGSYGSVTITKNISIINDGVGEAGTLVSGGGIGIIVNAGPDDRVSLRGLTIKGIGFGGGNGIRFTGGGFLSIENCAIRNHTGDGVQMLGNVAASAARSFVMSNTFVTDNGGNGIYIQPSGSGHAYIIFNRVEAYKNSAHGVQLAALTTYVSATVNESVFGLNGMAGIAVTASGGNFAEVTAFRSVMAHNTTAVTVSGSIAKLALEDSTLIGGTAWSGDASGIILSNGGNTNLLTFPGSGPSVSAFSKF